MNRIPLMSRGIIWLEFYATLKLFLRRRPVPIVVHENMRQRRMRFGDCIIQRQRLQCRYFSLWHGFVRGRKIVKRQCSVGIRQPHVAESEIRVALYRLLELLARSFDPAGSALVPQIPLQQVPDACVTKEKSKMQ